MSFRLLLPLAICDNSTSPSSVHVDSLFHYVVGQCCIHIAVVLGTKLATTVERRYAVGQCCIHIAAVLGT